MLLIVTFPFLCFYSLFWNEEQLESTSKYASPLDVFMQSLIR